jgi:hypothetical protein
MTNENARKTPWYLWPFVSLWDLLAYHFELDRRLLAHAGNGLNDCRPVLTVTINASPVCIPI